MQDFLSSKQVYSVVLSEIYGTPIALKQTSAATSKAASNALDNTIQRSM